MYFLHKPDHDYIKKCLATLGQSLFSYPEVGATRQKPPLGYTVDHNRTKLGNGNRTFLSAKSLIRNWTMFEIPWLVLYRDGKEIESGMPVVILIRVGFLWVLNACKVVYIIEENGAVERFGFAYGTLSDHAEMGEERFMVEWDRTDDSVWYDILAFSKPNEILPLIAYPFTRQLQKRFARDSMNAMRRSVEPAAQ